MVTALRSIIQSRDLIWTWSGRILRTRYQQTVLGGLWIIAQPLSSVIIFSIIFTYFVPISTGDIPYPVFSYVAIVPWTLLASSLTDMTESIVGNMQLITKIYFPREVLPLSSILARLVDYLVALSLLVILLIWYKVQLFPPGLMFLPVILLIQLTLIFGLGLLLSAANVFFRDVRSLLVLGLQVWFYLSPIIYPVTMVPDKIQPYYYLNPMAGILTAYRDVILNQQLPGSYLLVSAIAALGILFLGYWFFKRTEPRFADII